MTILDAIRSLKDCLSAQAGQGLVEYALIIAIVSAALIAALGGVAPPLVGLYEKIAAAIPSY